jgi:pimeloyl-ACP methyl ester carboxylesterase
MMRRVIEHITVNANGLSFNVATAGSGDRLALCLHGFPASSASFRNQMPLLARLGYRVWAPDLRGYGRTSRPKRIADYRIDKLEEDVAALIDASGAKHVVLIGHDWGAGIAWSFAIHGARPLERLIILNVPHPVCFERGLRTLRQLRRSWYILFFQLPWLPELALTAFGGAGIERTIAVTRGDAARFPREIAEEYRRNALEPGAATAMVNYYRALLPARALQHARGFPMIHTPTLMLWSESDPVLGKELTVGTEEHVKDLTLCVLPTASHWLLEEEPKAVNALIEAFLTGQPVPVSEIASQVLRITSQPST